MHPPTQRVNAHQETIEFQNRGCDRYHSRPSNFGRADKGSGSEVGRETNSYHIEQSCRIIIKGLRFNSEQGVVP